MSILAGTYWTDQYTHGKYGKVLIAYSDQKIICFSDSSGGRVEMNRKDFEYSFSVSF